MNIVYRELQIADLKKMAMYSNASGCLNTSYWSQTIIYAIVNHKKVYAKEGYEHIANIQGDIPIYNEGETIGALIERTHPKWVCHLQIGCTSSGIHYDVKVYYHVPKFNTLSELENELRKEIGI